MQQLRNRVVSVERADGKKDTRTYEKGNYVSNPDPALSQFTADPLGLAERETVVQGTVSSPDGIAFKTTKKTTIRDQFGNQVLEETYAYNGTSYERIGWTAYIYDGRGHVTQTIRHDGQVSSTVWNGDRRISSIDESGIETTYTYDALSRLRDSTKKGIAAGGGFPAQADIVTTTTYDAEGRLTSEKTASGSLQLIKSSTYDVAGRIKTATDAAGSITTYIYANGGRTQTTARPGGATEITDAYLDGQRKSVTGTAVVAKYFDHGVNIDGTQYSQEFIGSTGLSSPRWTKTTTDWLGRTVTNESPSFTGTNLVQTSIYNALGQLQKQTTTVNGVKVVADMLYEYDALGHQSRTGADLNSDGALTLLSTDRLSDTDTVFEKVGNDWFRVTVTKTYHTDNNSTPAIETRRERLNNFPVNGAEQTISEISLTNLAGNINKTTTTVNRAAKKQTAVTDIAESLSDGVSVTVNGLLQSSVPSVPQTATTYAYDALGRQTGVTDPRAGTTTSTYNSSGQLATTNDGVGTTTYEYYPASSINAGRLQSQMNDALKKVYFNYNNRGEVVQIWGDASYPMEYVFDAYGQRTELHTFRAGQNWGAVVWPAATTGTMDVTRWTYQESTGLLTQKRDTSLNGASFTYDEMGRIKTRSWARGVTCTYGYDSNTGELRTITYSDSTPAVTFTYDRGGRQSNITDSAGSHTLTFNIASEMATEQITGGILDGVGVNVGYDSFLRRNSLQSSRSSTTLLDQSYGYDSSSRMETITSGGQSATYAYYPSSGLLNTTTFTGGTVTTRGYDSFGRLQTIGTTPAADVAQTYAYTYNNLNQRTRVTREDSSHWDYLYNDRGEVTSGKKSWSDNSAVWGAQTEYSFDNTGNRSTAKNGGNQLGSLRQSTYSSNSLNQYSQRTVPGALDITGTANTAATVSVNNQSTVRKADYFYKELAVDNSTTPQYSQINVVGARANFGAGGEDAIAQQGGRAFLPQAAEPFAYDLDGNLTSDGRWIYTWDAENRLVSMEAGANVPAEAKLKLEFAYDYMDRRIQKKVYAWSVPGSSYQLQSTTKFVYEDWNLLAELDQSYALVRSYVRSANQLLMINGGGNTYQVAYDGNGNIGMLVKSSTGKAAASYDYDSFGQSLKVTGDYASQNPFRFSSQYADVETGLIYYGYRYLNPATGRWINRDPIGESGGINLYSFVQNAPISKVDNLGLHTTAEVRNKLISLHGRKLEFVLDEITKWGHVFEVTDYQDGPDWVGGNRVAYVNCKSSTLDEAAEWGLNALRQWAESGASDGGYFNAITRLWATFGDGQNDVPNSLGSTLDWLYLFSKDASTSDRGGMYQVNGGRYDLFNIYTWVYADTSRADRGPVTARVNITSNNGLHHDFWDANPNVQNQLPDGRNLEDQTHHFAGYLWVGARYGSSWPVIRTALVHSGDWEGGVNIKKVGAGVGGRARNIGDVNLGILGARWGAKLASSPGYVGSAVANDLRNGTGYQ